MSTRRLAEVLLLASLLLFLVLADTPDRTLFWSALFDAGHTPLFGVVALLVRNLIAHRERSVGIGRDSAAAMIVTLAIAAASEALQLFQANRQFSFEDLLRDAAGAGAFLLIGAARRVPGSGRAMCSRFLAVAAAVVLLAASGAELITTSALYIARQRAFPTLYRLDGSWWERRLVAIGKNRLEPGRAPAGLAASSAGPLARLDLEPALYSGLTFDEPYPDWRGYRHLAFTVVSDLEAPLILSIRVHDAEHDQRHADRFNRRLVVNPGANRVRIPIEDIRHAPDRREMDLGRIRGIVLFAYRLQRPTHLYLGPLQLE